MPDFLLRFHQISVLKITYSASRDEYFLSLIFVKINSKSLLQEEEQAKQIKWNTFTIRWKAGVSLPAVNKTLFDLKCISRIKL